MQNAGTVYRRNWNWNFQFVVVDVVTVPQDYTRGAFTRNPTSLWRLVVSRTHTARGSSWPGLRTTIVFLKSPYARIRFKIRSLGKTMPSPNSLTSCVQPTSGKGCYSFPLNYGGFEPQGSNENPETLTKYQPNNTQQ